MTVLEHSTGRDEQLDYEAAMLNIQRQAAEDAVTVSQFRNNFHAYAEDVLRGHTGVSFSSQLSGESTLMVVGAGAVCGVDVSGLGVEEVDASVTVTGMTEERQAEFRTLLSAHEHRVIAPAADGIGSLGIGDMPEGQLGEAEIGGDGRVSREMLADMESTADAKLANHAGKHERGHMDSVPLSGDLVVDGNVENVRTLYESYAELSGNRGVGEGAHYHRPGQPGDYGHAQEVGILLEEVVGRVFYEQTMTEDGDVGRLQRVLDERGRGQREGQIRNAA